jgi:cephalosporin hydroxylase
MAADQDLQREALDVLAKADRYNWIHQTTWMGEPILNLPQDMFALQEIIFKTKPEFIIEVGIAWGGSLLFYSTLMEVLGGKKIIGIDIFIPDDLRERINALGNISEKIIWLNGSSTEETIVEQVKEIIGNSKKVLVILDSNHTHDHVLTELTIYSKFVGKGYYIVCCDTVIDKMPEQKHRPRLWGPGNNPKTAVREFLRENPSFEIDRQIENKLLFTCNPGGYLVRRSM